MHDNVATKAYNTISLEQGLTILFLFRWPISGITPVYATPHK